MIEVTTVIAVVDGTNADADVLETAITRAERADATLVVAHVTPQSTYESKARAIHGVRALRRDGVALTLTQARDAARRVADRAARAVVGTRDVPYDTVGAVGRLALALRPVASAEDCNAVVLAAEVSWWRRRTGLADRRLSAHVGGAVVRVPRRTQGDHGFEPDATVDADVAPDRVARKG